MEQRTDGDGQRDAAGDRPQQRLAIEIEHERLELAAQSDDGDCENGDDGGRHRQHHIRGDGTCAGALGDFQEQRHH
jgi:hypothetical protein